jgi:hypothetical protein
VDARDGDVRPQLVEKGNESRGTGLGGIGGGVGDGDDAARGGLDVVEAQLSEVNWRDDVVGYQPGPDIKTVQKSSRRSFANGGRTWGGYRLQMARPFHFLKGVVVR